MRARLWILLLVVLSPITAPRKVEAGKLYWCDRNRGLVQRANLDGSDLETLIDTGSTNLRGIAIDVARDRLYYADNGADTISRASLGGDGVVVIVEGLGFPADVDLDGVGQKLYWCDQQRSVIERSNLDGSERETVIETPSPYYLDLDVPGGRLFWGDFLAGNISYVPIAGGAPVNAFTGQPRVRGVKLDLQRGEMVWCNRQSNHVQKRKIDGGPVTTVIGSLDTPHGLVIDPVARKAYWCDTGTDNHNEGGRAINRTDLDGKGVLETVAELSQPWDADLDYRTPDYGAYVARFFEIGRDAVTTAMEGDEDADGFSHLLEYGMASHPERKDLVPQYSVDLEGDGGAVFVYQRFSGLEDLRLQVEISDDMTVWRSNGPGAVVTGEEEVTQLEYGVERVRIPIVASASFLRLRVTWMP